MAVSGRHLLFLCPRLSVEVFIVLSQVSPCFFLVIFLCLILTFSSLVCLESRLLLTFVIL